MKMLKHPATIGLFTAVAMLAVGVPSLVSMPEYDSVETWYSDSTMTTAVGHHYMMCNSGWWDGYVTEWANITIYYNCISQQFDLRGEHNWGEDWYCDDGFDNDGDGWADGNDPDC